MRKVFVALLLLLVVLVAGILVAPSFVDWNSQKGRLAAQFMALTGRDLSIAGDVRFTLLPAPALSAEEVSLANLAGGSAPEMARVRRLDLRIALSPLLRGDVQVESLVLVEPEILLEVLPDGRKNWDILPADPATAAEAGQADTSLEDEASGDGFSAPQVQLNQVTLRKGRIVYRDDLGEERIDILSADLSAASLDGPYKFEGSAEFDGSPFDFDVRLGRMPERGAAPLNTTLGLPELDTALRFNGSVSNLPDNLILQGRLELTGSSLRAAAGELLDKAVSDWRLPATEFHLESDLVADLESLQTRNLKLKLADLSLTGGLEARYAGEPEIRLSLATKRLDLDKLLQGERAPDDEPAVKPETTRATTAEPAKSAEGTGPGTMADEAGLPAFSLPDDLSLEFDLVADSLIYREQVVRQVLVDGKLAGGTLDIRQAIALFPGGSDLAVSGRMTTPEGRPHLKATVEAASDNMRALLDWLGTAPPVVPRSRLRKASLSTDIEVTQEQVKLTALDLRFDVTRMVGGLAIALRRRPAFGIGLQVDKLNLDGYLQPEAKKAAAGDEKPKQEGAQEGAAGVSQAGQAAETGSSAKKWAMPSFFNDFDANMDIKFGSLVYQGRDLRDLRLDATLQAGDLTVRDAAIGGFEGARAGYRGKIAGLARDMLLDGSYEIASQDLGRLIKGLGMGAMPFGEATDFALRGSVKGPLANLATDSNLKALGGEARLAGGFDALAQRFDLGVSISHPDARSFLRTFDLALRQRGLKGGLLLQGRLKGAATDFAVEDFTGQAGDIKTAGRIALDRRGPQPLLTLALDTPVLPLGRLMEARTDGGGGGGLAPNLDRRWSRERIDLDFMRDLDADLTVNVGSLLLENLELKAFHSTAVLRNGVLDIKKFNGTLYDGALIVSGQVNARQRPQVALALTGIELNLSRILAPARKGDAKELAKRASGPITVNARLSSQGDSEAALLSNLTGQGELQGVVTVKVKPEEQLGSLALNLLGQQVKQIKGIADGTNTLLGAFGGTPAQLSGSFSIDRGILRTNDTRLVGRNATALTAAQVDLPGWRLDSRIDVYRAADRSKAYLTANLRGALDKPDVKIGGEPFQRGEAQPGAGQATGSGGQIDPGSLLKGLFGD